MEPFKRNLYWIPGDGKTISIWNDSILGETPIGACSEVENLKRWILNKGVNSLWDLSTWEGNNWIGWDLGNPPPDLEAESEILTSLLQGKSPTKDGIRDKRGWGTHS